uniref:Uncharacterized protein n=1 Tax=Podoviridae sp. ctz6O13 TaxID=2827757 RepID=A0A8S5TLC9_9CAUD|nr:MAG TPA: hypothetical protein [Podoviridae sp. ctz6O13]
MCLGCLPQGMKPKNSGPSTAVTTGLSRIPMKGWALMPFLIGNHHQKHFRDQFP